MKERIFNNMKTIENTGYSRVISLILLIVTIAIIASGCVNENGGRNLLNELPDDPNTNVSGRTNENRGLELLNEKLDDPTTDISVVSTQHFSEGRAWITVYDRSTTITANVCINTDGYIVFWEAPYDSNHTLITSDFKDGLSYMINEDTGQFRIFDLNGNITFESPSWGENLIMLGYGDGKFLVAEYISDFNTNEWYVGAIDKTGKEIVPLKSYESQRRDVTNSGNLKGFYLGHGVFALSYSYNEYENNKIETLINIDTQKILLPKTYGVELLTGFEDGYALISGGITIDDEYYGSILKIGTDGSVLEEIEKIDYSFLAYAIKMPIFSEGLMFWRSAYYDIYGNVKIELPEYEDKLHYCSPFKNGYAVITLVGADGHKYFTIINQKGEEIFEPLKGIGAIIVLNEKYFAIRLDSESIAVFDMDSTHVMTIVNSKLIFNELTLSDDFIRISNENYVNIKDGSIIGKRNNINVELI